MSARSRRRPNSAATKRARRAGRQSRIEPYAWLGAGAVTLGIGAALVGGAGVAHAEDAADGDSSSTSQSSSTSESSQSARQWDAAGDGDTGRPAGAEDADSQDDVDRDDSSESVDDSGDHSPSASEAPAESHETESDDDDVPVTSDDQPVPGDATEQPESEDPQDDSAPPSAATTSNNSVDSTPVKKGGDGRHDDKSNLTRPTLPSSSPETPPADITDTDVVGTVATPAVTSSLPAKTATSTTERLPAAHRTTADDRATSLAVPATGASSQTLNPSLPFTRLTLAVNTLLKPIGTLLTELGGVDIGRRRRPGAPRRVQRRGLQSQH